MRVSVDVQFRDQLQENTWKKLKQLTDARIALGRVGGSIPTRANLEFQLAHAQAKDAVLKSIQFEELKQQLDSLKLETLEVGSGAVEKDLYLKRPDLGRQLAEESRQLLKDFQRQNQQSYDVMIVVGDGLSARAIEANAGYFIQDLVRACQSKGWSVAPVVLASGSRVALGDEVAQILKAKMLVMLIGERPGLSSPDSMGIYFTYQAHLGCHDAMRNCISNVRPAGLSTPIAVQRLMSLMQKSLQLGLSGVDLKDEHEVQLEVQTTAEKLSLF